MTLLGLLAGCDKEAKSPADGGGDVSMSPADAGSDVGPSDATGRRDAASLDADRSLDATVDTRADDAEVSRPDLPDGPGGSIAFFENAAFNHDYGVLTDLPAGFGSDEFTVDFWIRPDASYPFGPTSDNNLTTWSSEDAEPYESGDWWYEGNFLIDGHNNSSFSQGTFSAQFYGSGRLRWLVGDGDTPSGGNWSAQSWPAPTGPLLVDDQWHHVAFVRRAVAPDGAQLELWVDGVRVDAEPLRAMYDLSQYWNDWSSFPAEQPGWFFGAEKQAAIGILGQYEDYKGLFAELRLWNIAQTEQILTDDWNQPTLGTESGLVGYWKFDEQTGTSACDSLDRSQCITFVNTDETLWSTEGPL